MNTFPRGHLAAGVGLLWESVAVYWTFRNAEICYLKLNGTVIRLWFEFWSCGIRSEGFACIRWFLMIWKGNSHVYSFKVISLAVLPVCKGKFWKHSAKMEAPRCSRGLEGCVALALVALAGGTSRGAPLPSTPADGHVAVAPFRTVSDTPKEGVKCFCPFLFVF